MDGTILNQLEALDFLGQSDIMTDYSHLHSQNQYSENTFSLTTPVITITVAPTSIIEPSDPAESASSSSTTSAAESDTEPYGQSDFETEVIDTDVITLPVIQHDVDYAIPDDAHTRHAALMFAGVSARTRASTRASTRALPFTPPRGISQQRVAENALAPVRRHTRHDDVQFMATDAPEPSHATVRPETLPPILSSYPDSVEALRLLDFITTITGNLHRLLLRQVSAYIIITEGAQIIRLYNRKVLRDFFQFLGEHTAHSTQLRMLFDHHYANKRMIVKTMHELRTLRR